MNILSLSCSKEYKKREDLLTKRFQVACYLRAVCDLKPVLRWLVIRGKWFTREGDIVLNRTGDIHF